MAPWGVRVLWMRWISWTGHCGASTADSSCRAARTRSRWDVGRLRADSSKGEVGGEGAPVGV